MFQTTNQTPIQIVLLQYCPVGQLPGVSQAPAILRPAVNQPNSLEIGGSRERAEFLEVSPYHSVRISSRISNICEYDFPRSSMD